MEKIIDTNPKLQLAFQLRQKSNKNSTKKMEEKFCDIMVANDVSKSDFGFNKDQNEVIIIDKNGRTEKSKKFKKICRFSYC